MKWINILGLTNLEISLNQISELTSNKAQEEEEDPETEIPGFESGWAEEQTR